MKRYLKRALIRLIASRRRKAERMQRWKDALGPIGGWG